MNIDTRQRDDCTENKILHSTDIRMAHANTWQDRFESYRTETVKHITSRLYLPSSIRDLSQEKQRTF